ncbi:general transcription factor IIE subunit 1-like [Prunus yedoensis var. nudiflora]|uniref:General transcription factor IIE subunit 1-like n=1 Tax=Prunus yedoensis var. nudiflora TaxID=2094558 RepID=A0A314ZMZ7_PRUYE|nr:general transcription factor IIE subunit 1-like [Prunus yedoensis var. nudiflora]
MEDDGSCFHRESCNGELVVASDSHARRPRGQELKDRLPRMEVQMKPVTEQLDRVKDLAFPELGSLQDWEASGRPNRQIRVKSKRDEDPAEDNVDWEEGWGPNDLEC